MGNAVRIFVAFCRENRNRFMSTSTVCDCCDLRLLQIARLHSSLVTVLHDYISRKMDSVKHESEIK